MSSNKTFQFNENTLVSPSTHMITDKNISAELNKILMRMIYRISKEEPHVLTDAGHVA